MDASKEIVDKYISGESTVKIGKEYQKSPNTIRNILIRNGVKMRNNKENSRKYHINDSVFSEINNEEQAYWLGFISADGYVTSSSGNKKIGISISSRDVEHLKKFSSFIESDYPIYNYKVSSGYKIGTEYSRILITSDKLYNDLVSFGVVEHKTDNLKFPSFLNNELVWHYLRGFCDGDGCITHNGNSYALKIMCTKDFCNSLIIFLKENIIDFKYRIESRKENSLTISINMYGKSAYQAIYKMYNGNSISLNRKNEIANKSLEYFGRLYQR